VDIQVDVYGAERAAGLVDRLSRRLSDNTPALLGLVDSVMDAQRDRFQGRGRRWKRLKPATVARDARGNRDPRPLVLTGALMRSLTVRGAPGQVIRVTPTSLTFGTRIFYAQFQKHMGRNPVGVTRLQKAHLVAELSDLLIGD
jgi:hypothetical protein